MTGTTSLAFPGGRKLAGWWRQLAPYRPQAIWVGHLLCHHVEALVRLTRSRRLDAFTLFLLRALTLNETRPADATLEGLDARLHLGRQVLRQALRELEAEGLASCQPDGSWTLTPLGRHALDRKEYARASHERRTFHFIDHRRGREGSEPHFLDLHSSTGIPWPAVEGQRFDLDALRACLHRPAEWKERHGFPLEVQAVLGVEPAAEEGPTPKDESADRSALEVGSSDLSEPAPWQQVIVDRPERVLAVLVLATQPDGGQALVGLAVRQDGWVLQTAEPLFVLGADWQETFPDLAEEPAPEMWRQAWRSWCEPRGLPADEVSACTLERQGERLRVTAPPSLIERLRATRSDALKGETWLLAGDGWIRTAVLVEVVEPR